MTVADLIKFLQTQPQDLPVAYEIYSEFALLEEKDIVIEECGMPREDGWIHSKRSDRPKQKYLMFPGN